MILGYRIEFEDGSFDEHVVCEGSEEACRAAADLLSAVSYSGPKRVTRAVTFTAPGGAASGTGDGRVDGGEKR